MLASDRNTMDDSFYNLIISFDMTSEEFREIKLPDRLAYYTWIYELSISKLRESLVVLENHPSDQVYDIWMMEDGDPKSFTKLFTFNLNTPNSIIMGFRGFKKTGELVVEIRQGYLGALAVYDPWLEHVNRLIGISGKSNLFSLYSYMETLLLLDQPPYF